LISKTDCGALMVERDFVDRYEGVLGNQRLAVGITDAVSQGRVLEHLIQCQGDIAEKTLPEVFRRPFVQTEEPFIQAIYDLSVPRMAFGRVCLTGDAAFALRPHTAARTSKAITNATALSETLRGHGSDVAVALKAWEPAQLRLGKRLEEHGKSLGDSSQFDR